MRDVIQKVIATEAEAKRIVEAARLEAERITSEARQQAEAVVAQARQQARAETEKILTTTLREAEQEKQEQVARIAAEIEAQIRFDEATRQHAVNSVLWCVCGAH